MKSIISTTIITIACFVCILLTGFQEPLTLNAQSSNGGDIAAKCVAAMGGKTGIKNLSNFKGDGIIKASFGRRSYEGKAVFTRKGIKERLDTSISFSNSVFKTIRAYNGETAWMERRGTVSIKPALNYQSDSYHSAQQLIEMDTTFSLAGETEIDGMKHFVLETTFRYKNTTFHISQVDYTITEIVFTDRYFGSNMTKDTVERRIRYADYKETNGQLFPHTMIFTLKGKKERELSFNTVTFNPPAPGTFFDPPKQELDLRVRDEILH
ncbi:MAG: outer membrane lipoprotein-sorting protein [bacterium]|nr:outer membrane lipoprotein-sorting protein [bacterium]